MSPRSEHPKPITGWELVPIITSDLHWTGVSYSVTKAVTGWRWRRLLECSLVCCADNNGITCLLGPMLTIYERHV